jgi:hypothetical protein
MTLAARSELHAPMSCYAAVIFTVKPRRQVKGTPRIWWVRVVSALGFGSRASSTRTGSTPNPYARVTELVQALQRGYLELEGVSPEAAGAARRRR